MCCLSNEKSRKGQRREASNVWYFNMGTDYCFSLVQPLSRPEREGAFPPRIHFVNRRHDRFRETPRPKAELQVRSDSFSPNTCHRNSRNELTMSLLANERSYYSPF